MITYATTLKQPIGKGFFPKGLIWSMTKKSSNLFKGLMKNVFLQMLAIKKDKFDCSINIFSFSFELKYSQFIH